MKLTAKERRQYLEEAKYDFHKLLLRIATLRAMDWVNSRKKRKAK